MIEIRKEKKEKTIFEKIIDREIPSDIIYEDEKHIAFLDIRPFEKGHLLVVPKQVYETIFEMPENEYLDLQKVVWKIVQKIKEKMGDNIGLNILQNNYEIAGQVVPHVHFHLIPRQQKKQLYYAQNEIREYDSKEEKTKILNLLKF